MKVRTDNTPYISARWEWIWLMWPKSGLVPSMNVFPFIFAIIHAPPDVDFDLLPSDAIINFYFIWIASAKLLFVVLSS